MGIDHKLLEIYRVLVEHRSISEAAKILEMTQPAVRAQITCLEAQVGFDLFESTSKILHVTERGLRFNDAVLVALGTNERLVQVAESIRTGATAPIVVASHPSASISIMPGIMKTLLANRPEVRVHLINRTSEGVREYFDAGGADVAIAEMPINALPEISLRTYEIECVAIMPKSHPLAREACITPDHFAAEPFIAITDNRFIAQKVRMIFHNAGIPFEPVAHVEFFSAICGLVAAGAGLSIVDRCSAQTYVRAGIAIRPFAPTLVYEIGVFSRQQPDPNATTLYLLDLLDKYLKTVAPGLAAAKIEKNVS